MQVLRAARATLRDAITLYWLLVRIVLPVMLLTKVAVEFGVIELLAPVFAPLMLLLGLPPELGFAWVTGILVGLWGGAVALFAIVPVAELTSAQVTIFMSLVLFSHALPIEQRIVQKAGPSFLITSAMRLVAGLIYGLFLHAIFHYTGWLQEPVAPHWIPAGSDSGWGAFFRETLEALFWMFLILLGLVAVLVNREHLGAAGRRQRQGVEGRDDRRGGDRQGELAVELPRQAADESNRNKNRTQRQGNRDNRTTHFLHGFIGCSKG